MPRPLGHRDGHHRRADRDQAGNDGVGGVPHGGFAIHLQGIGKREVGIKRRISGEALAAQIKIWQKQDGRPLYLVLGMLSTKDARAFLQPMAAYIDEACTVSVPDEALSYHPAELAERAHDAGIKNVSPAKNVQEALLRLTQKAPGRILICGSLYLAGHVLRENGQFIAP